MTLKTGVMSLIFAVRNKWHFKLYSKKFTILFLLHFWSDKCSLGENKRLSNTSYHPLIIYLLFIYVLLFFFEWHCNWQAQLDFFRIIFEIHFARHNYTLLLKWEQAA